MFSYSSDISVKVQDNVLSPEECEYIIDIAKERGLEENHVSRGEKTVKDKARTSTGTYIEHSENKLLHGVLVRLSKRVGIPLSRGEPATIQRYIKGQEYTPHLDAFVREEAIHDIHRVTACGNRVATIIVYLNSPHSGSTGFPNLGFIIKPVVGRILMFGNLDSRSNPHPLSLHCGLPPQEGEKWIMTLWLRERDYIPLQTS